MVLHKLGHLVVLWVRALHRALGPSIDFYMGTDALLAEHLLTSATLFWINYYLEANNASEDVILVILKVGNLSLVLGHFLIEIFIVLVNQEFFDSTVVYLHFLCDEI